MALYVEGIDIDLLEEITVRPLIPEPKRHRQIVIDWTGSEMSAQEIMLQRNPNGWNLVIDHEGEVFQLRDLGEDGPILIALQNQGRPPKDKRVNRGTFVYSFGKHKLPTLAATTPQLETLTQILPLICQCLGIPCAIPRKNEDPIRVPLTPKAQRRFEGIVLASHLSPVTVAPGPGVIEALDELEVEYYSDDEDDTDEDGEDQEVDDDEFDANFPEPS